MSQNKPQIISLLVEKRHEKHLTQTQVAKQMGTTASAIARLESGGGKLKHSPSLRTLEMYAQSVGYSITMGVAQL